MLTPKNDMLKSEPYDCGNGWKRLGRMDHVGRRSLWVRQARESAEAPVTALELRAGREGDDVYLCLDASNPQFNDILNVFNTLEWSLDISEDECPGGLL